MTATTSTRRVAQWLYRRTTHPDRTVRAVTPHWLVVVLPQRTLVEQTVKDARQWVAALGAPPRRSRGAATVVTSRDVTAKKPSAGYELLGHKHFREFWLASLGSNLGLVTLQLASAWIMTSLTPN